MRHTLESLIYQSPDAVAVARHRGEFRVVLWNPGAEALFGYSAAEMFGESIARLLPDDDETARQRAAMRAALLERNAFEVSDVVRLHKSGAAVRVDATYERLHDASGDEMVLFTFRDRRQHDDLLERLRQERRVVFGALTARLAHEVRNPLSSILLNLSLVREAARRDDVVREASAGVMTRADVDALLLSAESQVERIQEVLQQYVEAARGAGCLDDALSDLGDFLA